MARTTTMSAQAKFPFELFDVVIDFLHDDLKTLRACSLVSREWVASSRFHIFRSVTLHHRTRKGSFSTDCRRLFDIVSNSARISSFVKHLEAYGSLPTGVDPEPCLPSLLRILTSLRTLHILPAPTPNSTVVLNSAVVESIRSVVSTSLEELKVHACAFPYATDVLRILHSCRYLKALHLLDISFQFDLTGITEDEQWIAQRKAECGVSLDVLSLDSATIAGFFIHPLSPIDISSVRELRLKIHPDFMGAELIEAACSIERLEVDMITDVREDHLRTLSLSNNLRLRSLMLRSPVLLDSLRFKPLPWIHRLLSTISSVNVLEDFHLDVVIDIPPPHLTLAVYETSIQGWEALDTLLTQPQFSGLKRVHLDFSLDNIFSDTMVPSIMEDILIHFPKLNCRGILCVNE